MCLAAKPTMRRRSAESWFSRKISTAFSQLTALIQQRIRHVYRWQRPTPLPSRTAQSHHQSQLGVDGFPGTSESRGRSLGAI